MPLRTSRTFRVIRGILPRIAQFLTNIQEMLNTLKNCGPTTRTQVRRINNQTELYLLITVVAPDAAAAAAAEADGPPSAQ